MYFDALTLAAVVDELRQTILGGRIQRVLLTGPLGIGLEIYTRGRRYQLLASAHPQLARVHLVQAKLSRGMEQETPLLLLLRKYVLGGRIIGIEQPALERIVLLSIVKPLESRNRERMPEAQGARHEAERSAEALLNEGQFSGSEDEWELDEGEFEAGYDEPDQLALEPEDDLSQIDTSRPAPRGVRLNGELLRCELIIEPQDRRSNIILVDDNNVVLESVKRVTPRMSSRVIMPRQPYELPPTPEKRDPTRATAAGIEALAASGEKDLARALVAAYRGLSPQAAREAVFRATGQTKARLDEPLPPYTVAARLRELFAGPPAPSLVPGETGPAAYAPYALSHLPGAVAQPSISAALEEFHAAREQLTGHSQRRDAVAQQLGAARERLARQRDQIAGELAKARELERLRWEGEMIYAFLHQIQRGQTLLEVEDQRIMLDGRQSPVEQAQERFKQYDKAKSALAGLPERLQAVEDRLRGVDELAALLQLSDERDQIEQIAQEVEEMGYGRERPAVSARRKNRAPKVRPLHLVSSDGFDLYVGRSARQNEEVTFRIGRGEDTWVHVRIIHGAHVLVRSSGRTVPERTLEEAAGLAAYFSQARNEAAVEVDLCRRALVRKVPNGPVGLVTYRAERTLRVAPRPPW